MSDLPSLQRRGWGRLSAPEPPGEREQEDSPLLPIDQPVPIPSGDSEQPDGRGIGGEGEENAEYNLELSQSVVICVISVIRVLSFCCF
jgi:hypothetical protein